ncbi:hypothetical protein RB653_001529 [Dictyostelium firmibasis]|uniref:Queuine tRNA-ribosyltransferase accessory subunit 2 n=1 Tax=Dictyostelium firmibasis TaxID=79012 RepID=A0AAN7YWQ2_9MYCE
MTSTFKISDNKDEKCRVGTLEIGEKSYLTPSFMLYTKEGSPINLTKDLLNQLPHEKTHSLQLLFSDLFQFTDVLEKFEQGVHKFLALQDHLLFLLIRDSSSFVEAEFNDDSISVTTRKGKTKITIQDYIKLVKVIKPDFVTSLSVDIAWETSKKKATKIVNSSSIWLEKFLEANTGINTFGVIQGGKFEDLRMKSLQDLLKNKDRLVGTILSGFGTGETNEERNQLINKLIDQLPKEHVKLISGVGSPEEILSLVELGIDLFSTNYPNLMTEWGNALTFKYKMNELKNNDNQEENKINLWDSKFVIDATPIIKGCECFTCIQHTKAYIHHLLNTHEMLAEVLLTIHNVSHYLGFFEEIRRVIKDSQFSEYKKLFLEKRIQINNNSNSNDN